jgi:chromosome segregation ATPase
MKHQRRFENGARSLTASLTRKLIDDIERVVQILSSDIAAEEEKANRFNRSEAEYPMLARTLTGRRNNLRVTVAALEKRLSDLPADLA